MDRLSTLIAAGLLVASGCEDSGDAAPASGSRSRVNAVAAEPVEPADLDAFCESRPSSAEAPKLVWPALRQAPAAGKGKRRWINVWATWCRPCVEELPRLASWREPIGKRVPYELMFLSADGDPEAVAAFAADHAEVAGSLEIADAEALAPWLASLGLGESAALPVHLFVDPQDRIRCVRTSGVGDDDREAIAQLLTSL